jgi:hypothetical protein
MNFLDADLLCELFADCPLLVMMCTSKFLAKALAPRIETIRRQQALTLGLWGDVFHWMHALAKTDPDYNAHFSRVIEGRCHGFDFLIAELGRRCDENHACIEVHTSRPQNTMGIHVNLRIDESKFKKISKIAYFYIVPITHDRGTLMVEYHWSPKLRDAPRVELGYHRGFVAALETVFSSA